MRLQLICTLFMGTVIAIPYGGREVSLCCLRLYSMLILLTLILKYRKVCLVI